MRLVAIFSECPPLGNGSVYLRMWIFWGLQGFADRLCWLKEQGAEDTCGGVQTKQICDRILRDSATQSEGALQLRTQVMPAASCEASTLG